MSSVVLAGALGSIVGGPAGGLITALGVWCVNRWRAHLPEGNPQPRLIMMLLLVELRSGSSALAALQTVSSRLEGYQTLRRVARIATVSGLLSSLPECDDDLRPIIAQLARAQRSGASLGSAIRTLLEQDLARSRAVRLARARSLPVKLMIPVTLMLLPGLVLLLYAPDLIRTFDQLTGSWP